MVGTCENALVSLCRAGAKTSADARLIYVTESSETGGRLAECALSEKEAFRTLRFDIRLRERDADADTLQTQNTTLQIEGDGARKRSSIAAPIACSRVP